MLHLATVANALYPDSPSDWGVAILEQLVSLGKPGLLG